MTAAERRAVVSETVSVVLVLFDMGTRRGAQRPLGRDGLVELLRLAEIELRDREERE